MNGVAATLYLPEFASVSTLPVMTGTRSSDSEGYREPSCSCCQTGCDTGCQASETPSQGSWDPSFEVFSLRHRNPWSATGFASPKRTLYSVSCMSGHVTSSSCKNTRCRVVEEVLRRVAAQDTRGKSVRPFPTSFHYLMRIRS